MKHRAAEVDRHAPIVTRRNLLQGVTCIMATAALPSGSIAAASSSLARTMPLAGDGDPAVMSKLAAYMSEAGSRELSEDAVEKTKHHVLDTLASMVSAADLAPAKVAVEFARSYGGEKVATIVGSDVVCSPIEAAMVNAMLAHSDETDDSHAP